MSPLLPLIEIKDLCKQFPGTLALNHFNLTLQNGEIVGLLGPNGAGKTTAMHTLLGILTPTSGEVSVLGMSPFKERHVIAQNINFSSAYVQLPTNLTVMENLKTFARLYAVPNAKNKISDLLELFEISYLTKRLTGALSSGEKTRLNLCKCLLNDPQLLLLDEPTASLDPEIADTVRKILKKFNQEKNIGILYTSHNMPEIEQLCDRIVFIHQGRVLAEGTPKEVIQKFSTQNLEQVFIKIVRGEYQ
ncbi:MAG: ABC transporter ATP-binding protein [Deltaproteobacteria bacterium RIFCSPLOWO2_02_FULL_50_16]|nr:MAG: ABC transporter ATP-binding protein [Deltaproteobacteria bacterium GWA2_50_8]OGQ30499.1 MAG: ABC transporter ATP-binding protein [Deltaproteobacteria bacterium RIFCSPHIGHO2_02_FULL_50_15]OGQ56379.1 MAG: ABC transporter ATP-binding protein [Deltaproteobacteria bacterium RIFCSPLOWO2_02_FULL_50_16]OGQ67782.1 MAG: ABC transporter ATP-binding protein [Deltaproteobacteria bacterium RIFCSPLOWO2_12_FULL_50_11]